MQVAGRGVFVLGLEASSDEQKVTVNNSEFVEEKIVVFQPRNKLA
jgi:hypothetical protein